MALQLSSLLDASFDKHIVFEIIAWVGKKPLKSSGKLKKKLYVFQLVKNLLNLMRKRGRKPGETINEKPSKLNEETRKKTDHLLFCIFAYKR